MREYDFITTTHAKWILAGEHAVLRYHPALVFPLKDNQLSLCYQEANQKIALNAIGKYQDVFRIIFWGTLKEALLKIDKHIADLHGILIVNNRIPMGAGMGFSSALSVAITRWLIWQGWLDQASERYFAKELDDQFHGISSGIDIAGVSSIKGVYFKRNSEYQYIDPKWQPNFLLTYSERPTERKDILNKIYDFHKINPKLAKQIDLSMVESVHMSTEALQSSATNGFSLLCDGILQANECFERWGLIRGLLSTHMALLRDLGASAVKPMGLGDGGYVLSLWEDGVPIDLPMKAIRLFV